jgi:hypothetical protein
MARKSCQATSNASNSSILSPSSSLSQVSESVKTVFTEDDKALVRPFKRVKTGLSTRSKSTAIDRDIASQDATNNDNASTLPSDSSDIEIVEVDPEKELGTFVEYFHCRSRIHGHALQRL